ncbi:MAG TPA: [protein-PII] uridylyltransferase [Mycobacteriales bacterium]
MTYDPDAFAGRHGADLRAALTAAADEWLASLLGDPGPGVALVAVGSLGRRELTPSSDLDVLLLHDGRGDIGPLADRVWYPVWDAGVALDHAVRTVPEAVAVARTDLRAAVGLLDARLVAGSAELVADLREQHLRRWRADADARLAEMAENARERAERVGEVAYLLEPELKEARGGLRDAQALWQAAATQRTDRPGEAVVAAKRLLLDVRGELDARRRGDVLRLQDQDTVAAALGYADADDLMRVVSRAGRLIAYTLDVTWRHVLPSATAAPAGVRRLLRRGQPAAREPLADGVVSQQGEVVLAQGADPDHDATLPLRVAAAAARAGLPVAPYTLTRLASCPPLPDPWPAAAREELVGALAAGAAAVPVLESYDIAGLWTRLLPEWEHTRSRPQRNAYHRFTVDRHLLETASAAAALTRSVRRPDLLLVGALLHDIGKGLPGDHTDAGVRVVERLAPRLGFDAADTGTLVLLVRHHLLLADTAQRRDLDDPATIAAVAAAVGNAETLDLLAALTEADARATGTTAWSRWKADLLADLVRRARSTLGGTPPAAPSLSADQQALLAAREVALVATGEQIDVACPDRPGLIATVAGILALHRLEIRTLTSWTVDGFALLRVAAHPRFGTGPDWSLVRAELSRSLEDPVALSARVAQRAASYPPVVSAQPPAVVWIDDAVTDPVLEVRAPDGLGVLHRIAAAIESAGGDVHSARCQTLGADVVDTFTVTHLSLSARDRVAAAVLAALDGDAGPRD